MRAHAFATALAVLGGGCRSAAPAPPAPVETPTTAHVRSAAAPAPDADAPAETPQPVAVRINADYDGKGVDRWTRRFEHDGREVYDHRAAIVEALDLRAGTRVADVGAGTGLFTLLFAAAVGPTGRVWAVDVQAPFVEHVVHRAKSAGLHNVVGRVADQRATGLDPGSVDLAFLCDAYHHLELPRTYLADVRRALVPGGLLAIIDYDRTRPGTSDGMREHIRDDPPQFRREIEAAGFTLVAEPRLLGENFFMIFERSSHAATAG